MTVPGDVRNTNFPHVGNLVLELPDLAEGFLPVAYPPFSPSVGEVLGCSIQNQNRWNYFGFLGL